jgi:tRNA threonylcarbamoyladenosine biosynthesis protein TsaE
MKQFILGIDELEPLIAELQANVREGVVILSGDLAAGKTTLVKEIVNSLGVSDSVTSPTFSLQQCYGDRIFHYDIYNHGLEHFISLGMLEELDKKGLHFVEWGDEELLKILEGAGIPTVVIEIDKTPDNKREYRINYAHA